MFADNQHSSNICGADKVCFCTTHAKKYRRFLYEFWAVVKGTFQSAFVSFLLFLLPALQSSNWIVYFFFFSFFFLIQFHSPISTYLSFPMFSGVYTLHATLCIHAKSSRVFQQKSYLVLSYLVSKASRKQNRTFSSSLFPGSHVAIISFWLLHHCLSCHVSSVTSLVSSPPCSFYFKIYI